MKQKFTFLTLVLFSIYLMAQDKDLTLTEETIGNTYYDLQTWRTIQNRIFYFDDGTIGSVWNMGFDYPGFEDMGIGYNYFDGDNWAPYPTQSITTAWAINPSYTTFLENGEMCISQGDIGLFINSRENKGTGNWEQNIIWGSGFKHPVVVTNGVDLNIVQLLYLKADENFIPTPAQPFRGFIWYARSTDGGQTWDVDQQISELGPDNYLGFTIGSYCWAEPKGDVISFIAGDYLTDLVLMKSEDGGDSWQKTVIWEHPYPMFDIFTFESDTFYCNNGGITIALNNQDQANIAFTLSRVYSTIEQDTIWYETEVGGVVYWNENRPTFSNNINALNPYFHPDSELEDNYSLIGWMQDINGNDTLELEGIKTYPTPGLCTMPQIVINDMDEIYVAFSAVTEGYTNSIFNYRHIWVRPSLNGDWWGNFTDLNDALIYIFSECVYPSLAPNVDDFFYLVFQEDNEPGVAFPYGTYENNNIRYMTVELGWNPTTWVLANFNADTTVVHEGDTVYFINLSTGCPPNVLSYEWWFEGGDPSVSYEENPIVIYNNQGIYDVKLEASISTINSNELLKEDYITVLPATNFKEINKNENIEIYPNPGNGLFTINLNHDNFNETTLAVYNILGENIMQHQFGKADAQFKLDLTKQENGIYFIQIKNGSTLTTKKIAVQH